MTQACRLTVVAITALCVCNQAMACGEALGERALRLKDAGYTLVLRSTPDPVIVGKHFTLDVAVCPRDGARTVDALRVDATMPEHKHGMNYQPSVRALGKGLYRAEGLMFHMPGRWELSFDVRAGDTRVARLTQSLQVD